MVWKGNVPNQYNPRQLRVVEDAELSFGQDDEAQLVDSWRLFICSAFFLESEYLPTP